MAATAAIVGAGAAVASAGSGIAGGIMGRSAASKSAAQQQAGIQQGIDYEQQIYDATRGNFQPYIDTGHNALSSVAGAYGLGPLGPAGVTAAYKAFQGTPFYQFPLSQGIDAMNRSAAARGLNLSGGQMNALQAYGQNYASSNFQNYINGLAGLAGGGLTASQNLAQVGLNIGQNILGARTGQGVSAANGTVGGQNQTNNALGQLGPLLQGIGGLAKAFGGSGSNDGTSYAQASPAVNPSAPDYTGGATSDQLSLLGLPSSGFGSGDGTLA